MWDYTDKVKEYYLHPRNVGEVEDADVVAEVGSLVCGDALKLSIKLDESKTRIVDAKFKTFGCGSAIASSSVLTELIKGKTIDEALKITNKDIADFLGGLPDEKMHCSVMAEEALEMAVKKLRGESIESHDETMDHHSRLVCKCFGVTEHKILKAIEENELKTVDEVTHYTKAGGACGKCKDDIQIIIDHYWRDQTNVTPAPPPRRLSNLQKINLIQKVIADEIGPAVKQDGGHVEIIDIVLPKVIISLTGTCSSCPVSSFTVDNLKRILSDRLDESIEVELESSGRTG